MCCSRAKTSEEDDARQSVRKERTWLEMCNQDLDVLEQRQGSAAAVTRSGMVSKAQSGEREL